MGTREMLVLVVLALPLTQGCCTALVITADLSASHDPLQVSDLSVKSLNPDSDDPHRLMVNVEYDCGLVRSRCLVQSAKPLSVVGPFNRLPTDTRELRKIRAGARGRVFTLVYDQLRFFELVQGRNGRLAWKKIENWFGESAHYTAQTVIHKTIGILLGVAVDTAMIGSLVLTSFNVEGFVEVCRRGPEVFLKSGYKSSYKRLTRRPSRLRKSRHRRRQSVRPKNPGPGTWTVQNRSSAPFSVLCCMSGKLQGIEVAPGASASLTARPGSYGYTLRQGSRKRKGRVTLRAGKTARTVWE
jgi:hypothetical protein